MEMRVNETYESFVLLSHLRVQVGTGVYECEMGRSWTTKTGYMMGVLQLAAAAQDATYCGTGRCVLRVIGVGGHTENGAWFERDG